MQALFDKIYGSFDAYRLIGSAFADMGIRPDDEGGGLIRDPDEEKCELTFTNMVKRPSGLLMWSLEIRSDVEHPSETPQMIVSADLLNPSPERREGEHYIRVEYHGATGKRYLSSKDPDGARAIFVRVNPPNATLEEAKVELAYMGRILLALPPAPPEKV